MPAPSWARRLPVGAEIQPGGGVHFRVWAPKRNKVQVVVAPAEGATSRLPQPTRMTPEDDGCFAAFVEQAQAGDRYGYLLDDEDFAYPDVASRFQPEGCHKLSEVIDPAGYRWGDQEWRGVGLRGQVLYELHLGAFTPEGTWQAAAERLPHLAELGVTIVELMPVNEFQGRFGWGYDGVQWFAPTRLYGRPDDFRRFVDQAHQLGLGVILDVVYNHFGPSGNYTGAFSDDYLSKRHGTEWGEALNFDGPNSRPVRQLVISNAAYWIDEYHLDGLRLDATQALFDDSPRHILAELGQAARQAAGERGIVLYAENELQLVRLVEPPEEGGDGLDGLWNDDFHHAARVAATGHAEFYYGDYAGSPQELVSAVKWGYLYQGQWHERQQKFRGSPAWHIDAARFVTFLQNHDQVANSGQGWRLHRLTSPGRHRALTALMLLAPGTPMLFMGEEFSASAPFLYFADHDVDLMALVRQGRQEFLRQFPRLAGSDQPLPGADPESPDTFQRCKLDWSERAAHAEAYALHRDLIKLRKEDPVIAAQDARAIQGAVVGPEAFVLRYFGSGGDDRLLLVNLGRDLHWHPTAEPLLAAPAGKRWALHWSSEAPRYGGSGTAILNTRRWSLPGHAAILLRLETIPPEPPSEVDDREKGS